MFEILAIIAFLGVLKAVQMIIEEHKNRKKSIEKLKRFEEKHPRKEK